NLGLLFAVGVAIGLARENHGAAGLAAVVAYLVTTQGAQVFITPPAALLALTGGTGSRHRGVQAERAQDAHRPGPHPVRPAGRGALQPLPPDQSARLPRLLRRQ